MYLRLSPIKGVMRFGKSGKLTPRFVGPFEIIDRVGPVAYRIALLPQLSVVHNVFHVSILRKYEPNPSLVIPFEALVVREDLSYKEQPVQILDRRE